MTRLACLVLLFLNSASTADDKPADHFPKGSQWVGVRTINTVDHDWSMRITERDVEKATFHGKITIHHEKGKHDTYDIKGFAGVNTIEFTTEDKGKFKQAYKGTIKGGEISFTFHGKNVDGDEIDGKGRLKPKPHPKSKSKK